MNILCDRIANPNNNVLDKAVITINGNRISSIDTRCIKRAEIILENSTAFPGLINIHDHLKYSWYKRIGCGEKISKDQKKFSNVYNWLENLYKQYDDIFTDNNDSMDLLFQLGLYKQIFSATTTVLNHSRYSKQVIPQEHEFVNIFDDFERELVVQPELLNDVTKHQVSFGKSIKEAHNIALNSNPKKPFVIHVAEGVDNVTEREVKVLDEMGILTPESILVHCINTKADDIELIVKGGCSIVWCPYTSKYIYGKYANIPSYISKGVNVCIGTDSSCSGSRNLVEELKFAKMDYEKTFDKPISNVNLFDMVTINAAKALMCDNQIGKIEGGYLADIAFVDSNDSDPYEDIFESSPESIIALLCKGKLVYGDEYLADLIPKYETINYSSFSINGRKKVIVGDPSKVIATVKKGCCIDNSVVFPFIPKDLQINGVRKESIMYSFKESEIEQLKAKNFLDGDGHPSAEAYKHVFSSPSADFDQLAINIERHGRDCPICNERYKSASNELLASIREISSSENDN